MSGWKSEMYAPVGSAMIPILPTPGTGTSGIITCAPSDAVGPKYGVALLLTTQSSPIPPAAVSSPNVAVDVVEADPAQDGVVAVVAAEVVHAVGGRRAEVEPMDVAVLAHPLEPPAPIHPERG